MKRILLPLLLAFGVACAAVAQVAGVPAGTSAGPYSATVPVAGTSDAQRTAAIADALEQVLGRVSPGSSVSPDVLAKASGYARDYHYRRAAGGGLELQVDFDPGAVGRLVAQAGGAASGAGATGPGSATSAGTPVAQGGSGTLWIDGIDNSHAFAAALAVLRGDPSLHDVTPVAAEGDGLLVALSFDQPLAAVLAELTGPAGHLAPDPSPHPDASASLRWVP